MRCMTEPKACLHHKEAASRVSSAKGMHLQAGPLLKLQCPCLFAHGDRDALCPVERLAQTQQEMPQPCESIVIQVLFLSVSGESCKHQLDMLVWSTGQ